MKATEIPARYMNLGATGSLRVVQVFGSWDVPCVRHQPWARHTARAMLIDDRTGKSFELCQACLRTDIGFVPGPIGNATYFGRDPEQLQSVDALRAVEEISLEGMRAELGSVAMIAAMRRPSKRPAIGHVTPRKAVIGKIVKRRKR
jgi:hypothetical protein